MRAPRLGGDQLVGVDRDADAEGLGFGRHGGSVTRRLRCNCKRPLALLCGASLALLACLPLASASAAYDPIGGGTTKLALDKRFVSFLQRDGVKLTASAGAKRRGNAIVLPVSSGSIDPTIGKGSIEQEGTIVFQNARGRVPLRDLTVKTKHSPLIAKVGGGQLKIGDSPKLGSSREGFGSGFSAQKLELSAKVATRLNKKLRPATPFAAGQPLGSLRSKTQPQTVTILESGRATVVLDPAIVAKLKALFVSINPIFPAEHVGSTFTFPIVLGGAIAPDASIGTLRSGGDVEFLQLGGGQIFWHELWFDLGLKATLAEVNLQPSPPYPGKLGQVGVLDLGAAAVSSDPKARTIAVTGAPLTLQAQTAASFNQAFAQGKEAFKAGEALGTLSFTAQGQ